MVGFVGEERALLVIPLKKKNKKTLVDRSFQSSLRIMEIRYR